LTLEHYNIRKKNTLLYYRWQMKCAHFSVLHSKNYFPIFTGEIVMNIIFFLLCLPLATFGGSQTRDVQCENTAWRLPRNVRPTHYEVSTVMSHPLSYIVSWQISCIINTESWCLHRHTHNVHILTKMMKTSLMSFFPQPQTVFVRNFLEQEGSHIYRESSKKQSRQYE